MYRNNHIESLEQSIDCRAIAPFCVYLFYATKISGLSPLFCLTNQGHSLPP